MSLEFYRFLHFTGIVMLLFSLGLLTAYFSGGAAAKLKPVRISGFVLHGIGVLLIIISGFGMAARMGIFSEFPFWLKIKLLIWVLLVLVATLLKRVSGKSLMIGALSILLAMVAAYFGVMHT